MARIKTGIKLSFLIVLLIGVVVSAVFLTRKPPESIYRFNSGLHLSFNLNEWHIEKNPSLGDILQHDNKNLSIALTTASLETDEDLNTVVDSRLTLINKENVTFEKVNEEINGLKFVRVNYFDKGDENVNQQVKGVSFITIYNKIYTTIQIFYESSQDLEDALKVIRTVSAN